MREQRRNVDGQTRFGVLAGSYLPASAPLRENGIDESHPLDRHRPYGCSKGAADEYIIDYERTFGLHAVVFRTNCIYDPRHR